ncbi:hypothetical protein RFI_35050 [Reticulomyxa filosa]|uniref:Uncharacterized protein n=1 Tax=Reticulomyxa filosa TaxID=46433 RepID=X6LMP1_RETFI|nr:hypothetical protein RFI_35050 [Reticulomyxa filosa]|eukprot:ETO02387.1 hypothetical protein RFI_35050 [Reticulomyxa filosa]
MIFFPFSSSENPFKVLLNEPEKFINQRKPGERLKKETIKTSFTICYCRNQHPFFVKESQIDHKALKCPDPWCGFMIDCINSNSKKITIINGVDEDEKQNEEVSPMIYTLLQFLSHLTILLRDISISRERASDIRKETKHRFLLLSKMTEMKEEILCMALHDLLCEFPQWFNKTYPNELDQIDSQIVDKFERKIEQNYSQFFIDFKKSIFIRRNSVSTSEIDQKIKEKKIMANSSIPQLFLVARIVSSENLLYKFYNNPELPKQYPLLFHTLKSIDDLEYVKCLTGIGQWTKHCHLQFSGILTKKECETKTITSIINDGNNTKYKIFWQQLVKCWNSYLKISKMYILIIVFCKQALQEG